MRPAHTSPSPVVTRTALGARLAALGRRSPAWTAACYALPILVSSVLIDVGGRRQQPALALLGVLVWLLAGIGLVLAIAWYRDDDTVGAGVICGFTVVGVVVAVRVVQTMIEGRSVGAGLLVFMTVLLPMVIAALLAAAIGVALVWVARELAPGFGAAVEREARPGRRAA